MMTPPIGNREHMTDITPPLSLLGNFFIYVHLHEAKQMLNEVKEQLLCRNFSHQPETIPFENTIYFFERLEELLNAAYLLHRSSIAESTLKDFHK